MPNLLDKDYDNLAYLSLDDFANVDYDDLSDMFKLWGTADFEQNTIHEEIAGFVYDRNNIFANLSENI